MDVNPWRGLEQIKGLVKQQRYQEARWLLQVSEHPEAGRLLLQLDALMEKKGIPGAKPPLREQQKGGLRYSCLWIGGLMGVLLVAAVIAVGLLGSPDAGRSDDPGNALMTPSPSGSESAAPSLVSPVVIDPLGPSDSATPGGGAEICDYSCVQRTEVWATNQAIESYMMGTQTAIETLTAVTETPQGSGN